VLRRDPAGSLRFASLQGVFASAVRNRHPSLNTLESMIWVEPAQAPEPERVFVRSAAALRVARYLGGWWRLALVAHAIPAFLRDAGYDLVAAHRHALARGTCFVPRPSERGRFLE
jgi:predicted DCC family thiol-disulfide oxidoreductase YuxK